jgi:hypothetical protein
MRGAEVGQGRRGTFGHTDLVCVERQRDHRVVADQRGQFDDAGGAVCVEDAAVGRFGRAMVAQQLDSVVVDGLLVWRGEAVAAVTQRLDGLLGEAGLARLALVREPLELAAFSSLAGRNAIFLLALILMASPVAGFRPILAARFRTWRMPRPVRRILSPLFR